MPIAQEVKNKNNNIEIIFYVFNKKTYNIIKKNKNLYSILSLTGSLHLFGWKVLNNHKILNILFKIINLLAISINLFF